MKTITGFPITFLTDSVNLGNFVETIRPSAIDRTLRERSDIVGLRNHDDTLVLGRSSAGTLKMEKRNRGLYIDLTVDESVSYAADLVKIIDRGDARGGSFAFRAIDDVWSLKDGMPYREVIDMSVREVSVGVSFPAYQATRLVVGASDVRSVDLPKAAHTRGMSVKLAERCLRLAMAR